MREGFIIIILMVLIYIFDGEPDLWDMAVQERDAYIQQNYNPLEPDD